MVTLHQETMCEFLAAVDVVFEQAHGELVIIGVEETWKGVGMVGYCEVLDGIGGYVGERLDR